MIVLFEGFPGSGKSYDAVRKILSNLRKGRRVLTNIDGMDNQQQRTVIQHYLDLDDYQIDTQLLCLSSENVLKFWEYVLPGDIIIIDEAQNYFNARDWQQESNRKFNAWASEHRHNGNDLFLITPNQARIDKAVRDLVEWFYRYKKLNMFGSMVQKGYVRFAFYGRDIEPIGKKICKYDSKIFLCYKSFFQGNIKEHATMKHANILKHPIILSIPVCLIVLVYFLSKSTFLSGDLFGSQKFLKNHNQLPEPAQIETSEVQNNNPQIIGYINGQPIIKKKSGGFNYGS